MWTNHQSLRKEKLKVEAFKPPFCSNPYCDWHRPEKVAEENPFIKFGVIAIARWPYESQRYRCKKCKKTFSQSFFTLQYRDRKPDTYEEIHDLLLNGYSGRSVAEKLKLNEDTVRRRKKKLARWALLSWAKDIEKVKIKESVAFDGLENFSYSQYDPNNLNHAVGRDSYFVYDFNLSAMNRKGEMSDRQKGINNALVENFGKYKPSAIRDDSKRLFERLLAKTEGHLHLHTDKHKAYRRAIDEIEDKDRLVHVMTSSKLARNFRNRLFAINHTDMLTRHHLGTFKRETIAFAKNTISMLESFILLAVHKNYLRPQFKKKHKLRPFVHKTSPAMALGLRTKIHTFRDFYRQRISVHHVSLNPDWQDYFDSTDLTSRRCIRPYAGI